MGQGEHEFIESAEGDAEQTIRRAATIAALIDKLDLCAGASGGNHGLLHSGARSRST